MLPKLIDERLLTATEVACFLGFTSDTIYRYARASRLPGVKIGGRWRFEWPDVQLFLGSCGVATEEEINQRLARQKDRLLFTCVNGKGH